MVKYRIEIDRRRCTSCGYCYTLDPMHFEPAPKGLFAKVVGRFASSLFLSKSQVVGGETDFNASVGIFDDEEINAAREAEATCPASGITITEL